MNEDNIIVWQTNNFGGGFRIIDIPDQLSNKEATAEFKKKIVVTNSLLCLSNYTDLTMAAQFDDEKIPSKYNADKVIHLENGFYELTIRRMFNPDEDMESDKVAFEIITRKILESSRSTICEKISWWAF